MNAFDAIPPHFLRLMIGLALIASGFALVGVTIAGATI